MSAPCLAVFVFNGSILTRATVPGFLHWIFEVPPANYVLQVILTPMACDASIGLKVAGRPNGPVAIPQVPALG